MNAIGGRDRHACIAHLVASLPLWQSLNGAAVAVGYVCYTPFAKNSCRSAIDPKAALFDASFRKTNGFR